jgi:hypothetical protein
MIARRAPKSPWGVLALVAVVGAVALAAWLLLAPAPLTPAEDAMLGTWAMGGTGEKVEPRLDFTPDHSVVQTFFDNGPNAPPRVHHFEWWVEGDRLVFDVEDDSLLARATRPLRPHDKVVLLSVTRNAATVRTSDGRLETWTRVPAFGETPDTGK